MDVQKQLDELDAFLAQYALIMKARQATGVRQSVLVLSATSLLSLFILWQSGADPLANLIGFIYPLYASYKALRSPSKDDDTEWLVYWIAYGFFTLIEDFCEKFLDESNWGPIYYALKIVFLLWLMLPQTKGANKVFTHLILPFLNKYEGRIDQSIRSAISFGGQAYDEMKDDVKGGANKAYTGALFVQQAAKVISPDRSGLFSGETHPPPHSIQQNPSHN